MPTQGSHGLTDEAGATKPQNKGMKQTKPEHIGASQLLLIRGVRRLARKTTLKPIGWAALLIQVHQWWRYDPDYAPPLPSGALRGDVRKQVFHPTCHVPKYFYVDEARSCLQCGERFTFRAAEQKHWYETLKFNFRAVPVRCLACRRRRRSEGVLREQIAMAREEIWQAPSDPAAQLALARALVEYHQRTNQGDLAAAVAAARKAHKLWPEAAEPLYWEGMAQVEAKRSAKARESLAAFLVHPAIRAGALKRNAEVVILGLEPVGGQE